MQILFLHDNFPAQFGGFARYLSTRGWDVWFGTQKKGAVADGIRTFNYAPHRGPTDKIHPYAVSFEKAAITGQAVVRAAQEYRSKGLKPDIVMAHSGWGPGLFAKEAWPNAKYAGYFEWYYRTDAPDVEFLGLPQGLDNMLRSRSRNAAILMDLAHCDVGFVPTYFQKKQFPACFSSKLTVCHDGVDTDYFSPSPDARLKLPGLDLSRIDEIVTYVARGMEPYRGFPEFMYALEVVLRARPNAHAVVVGEDRVAYGRKLAEGDSFKKRALVDCKLDWDRVHFTGLLPRDQYRLVLQTSSVHVYLTVPFVLSWSMLEAMSAGCAIVAWDVEPIQEIERQGKESLALVPPGSPQQIAEAILQLMSDAKRRSNLARPQD